LGDLLFDCQRWQGVSARSGGVSGRFGAAQWDETYAWSRSKDQTHPRHSRSSPHRSQTLGLVSCEYMSLRSREISHHSRSTWQLVAVIDMYSPLVLYPLGFRHHSSGSIFHVFPPRPFTTLSNHSPAPLPYWYRPHRSKTKTPVLFLHGIGVLILLT